eukprot:TRINITY_DN10127_c0_g1_i3.p1 TRINITY_DN10127_c0_g1~~TRINITY_DN10127_c0_g1_i3.p1  ORF type:complete len:150 (-),score=15.32 TRINITY_DN10127_c0_g1_i3:269-718(-)
MVLFDSDGKIKKYENVQDILQEFYESRLRAYLLRKRALLKSMEHNLSKITNQARFIMMIIDEKLKIAKRPKLDILRDLKKHKFETWTASKDDGNTLRNRAKATDAFEEEKKMDVDVDDDDDRKWRIKEIIQRIQIFVINGFVIIDQREG